MEKIQKIAKVATLQANLFNMDFAGNHRILSKALQLAGKAKVSVLVCPELCIPGPDCEDHFFEKDTVTHSWEVLADLLNTAPADLLFGLGMPVYYNNALYSCVVYCYNKSIVLIRPKTLVRDTGNSRQSRWFASWTDISYITDYALPEVVKKVSEQETCKFGGGLIRSKDGVLLAPKIDIETWSPLTDHTESLLGADIIMNSAASYHEISRYEKDVEFIRHYSIQHKCVLMYANHVGCNGNRLYYDGGSFIVMNGSMLAQAPRFSLEECSLAVANVCIEDLRSERAGDKLWAINTYQAQDSVEVLGIELSLAVFSFKEAIASSPIELKAPALHEELALSAGNWLWDYLRRAGATGFFIPASGGADSSTCASLVGLLSERLFDEYKKGNVAVIEELKRITGDKNFKPANSKEIVAKLLYTAYLGTVNSSKETRDRAKKLTEMIGVNHIDGTIDDAVQGIKSTVQKMTGFTPKFESMGGTRAEDLALQNVQARSRLILSYFLAQVLPVVAKRNGFFLVMATGNGDECIRGYFTKYDNSSGDLDPIGSWSKSLINTFLEGWAHKYPVLKEVREATPSAELKPMEENKQVQTDEMDMGFTYAELGLLGKLRKVDKCGPVSMFEKLLGIWTERSAGEIAEKVKKFFIFQSGTRHKMATLPPGLHSTPGNCDDNRYDHRQILYNIAWKHQFDCLDKMVAEYEKH